MGAFVLGAYVVWRNIVIRHRQKNEEGSVSYTHLASMGVALYPSDGESYRELFVHADEALYASKRQGRGCYRFYNESMRGDASELTPMDNELREGSARVATEHGAEGGNGE